MSRSKKTASQESDVKEKQAPQTNGEDGKDKIALIVSIVFVVAIGLLAYRYFNDPSNELNKAISNIKDGTEVASEEENTLSSKDIRIVDKGSEETTESEAESGNEAEPSNDGSDANVVVIKKEQKAFIWSPKNYNDGDIEPGQEHRVVSGDTLWELAEGAYGDGSQWTKIRDANADMIGYLPNGQQSLIVVGQVLTIPV